MDPIYNASNCSPAYELRWSLAIFAKTTLPPASDWLTQLISVVERDGVRILEYAAYRPPTHQFLLSTRPDVAPPAIVKSVKGRLQHRIRATHPNVFRRNFSLTSVGRVNRDTVEAYVADQLGHHRMADPRVLDRLARFQLAFEDVDLSQPIFSSHGRYHYNLHLVLVHDRRWCEIREDRLEATRDMAIKVAKKKRHRMSRLALLADHLHLTLGCAVNESPQDVALSYLNNLAYVQGMQAIYQFSYYVGTFGDYNMGAVRRRL
jgi:REP element-mobilizing transposase RayT